MQEGKGAVKRGEGRLRAKEEGLGVRGSYFGLASEKGSLQILWGAPRKGGTSGFLLLSLAGRVVAALRSVGRSVGRPVRWWSLQLWLSASSPSPASLGSIAARIVLGTHTNPKPQK